jgi:hypothetical protein
MRKIRLAAPEFRDSAAPDKRHSPRGRRQFRFPIAVSSMIQFLLGHVSVETTERYLGCKQRLRQAVNDKIGLEH